MPSLSYREKSLYGELLADLAVFLPYFVYMHLHDATLTVSIIAASVTLLILIRIVLQGIIAAFSRSRLSDERDRLIRLRGYRAGYLTIVAIMLVLMSMLWLHSSLHQIKPEHMALHFLTVFFGVLMLAEVVKTIAQIVAYRRPM